MDQLFDCIPCAGLVLGPEGIDAVNRQAAALFGRTPASLRELVDEHELALLETQRRLALIDGQASPIELKLLVGGEPRALEVRMAKLLGSPDHVVALLVDVSHRVRDEDLLTRLALHDGLTGLPNRAQFLERVGALLAAETPFAVALVDLDGFKAVNDTSGHEAGDQVLQEVGEVFRQVLGARALVARLGGDEFGVILEVPTADDACAALGSIHRALTRPVLSGRHVVGASIGVALGSLQGASPGELLAVADAAMYRAKKQGKGRTVLGETSARLRIVSRQPSRPVPLTGIPALDDEHEELLGLVDGMVSALRSGEDDLLVRTRLACLEAALREHFASEESLLRSSAYPRREAHEREHAELLAHLTQPRVLSSRLGLTAVAHHVRDWIFSHTRHSDRHFADWHSERCVLSMKVG